MVRCPRQPSSSGNLSQIMRSPCVSKGWGTGSLLGQIRFTDFGSSVSCLHSDLTRNYNLLVQDPDSVPDWLSQGITTLIPKNDKTDQAKNYRPITCLSVFYKTLTSVIKQRIEGHLSQGNLMASEQKGCQQGSFGAKDHLLINKLLTEDCKARHRSLSMAWVDYQKAYDSVPHSWVLQCLQLHKISPVLCRFLSRVMEGWRTSTVLSTGRVLSRRGSCRSDGEYSRVTRSLLFSSVWLSIL